MSSKKDGPMGIFDEREISLIKNCRAYAQNEPAGLTGHNLMIIIAKLVDIVDLMEGSLSEEGIEVVTKSVQKVSGRFKYSKYGYADPAQSLFDQIGQMTKGTRLTIVNSVAARRTAEEIAKAQNRGVIYICPDGIVRNSERKDVGKVGESLHGTEYAGCIPFSFASDEDFTGWMGDQMVT